MTIDEAIEVLTAMRDKTHIYSFKDIKEAEGLGIEALKFIQRLRSTGDLKPIELLPGETEK